MKEAFRPFRLSTDKPFYVYGKVHISIEQIDGCRGSIEYWPGQPCPAILCEECGRELQPAEEP